ncbi:regulator [Nakamurella sp. YIM 132087]|uniref:Regulator n=1 Tax=Nakamurella alba TaxID=2665158 RepID=A0A7K1FS92_9ACTN|nr:DUF5685 family protein [Nakamurella alba]MTD16940.1 regulator [Nakamurella alba]
MFGVVHACRHTLGDELLEQWRAHLCGLCLTLRDSRGQAARATTNTDAVMLSVLLEAQQPEQAPRRTAGPCALRGMRTAEVVPSQAVSVRLGATASLTLAAAKAADVIGERRVGLGSPTGPAGKAGALVKAGAAGALAGPLRRGAFVDRPIADSIGALQVLEDLDGQAALESAVRPGDPLSAVVAPTASATGRIFAASATLAGVPENEQPLREIGEAFGALAHLLDAVEDQQADARAGAFNPITATGAAPEQVRSECVGLVRRIRAGYDRLQLRDNRLVRALLVDGSRAALHRAFGGDRGRHCTVPGHAVDGATATTVDRRAGTADLGYPGPPPPGPSAPPPYPPPNHPAPGYPPPGQGDPGPPPGPPPPPPDRPFWRNVLPWVGVYCTGYACCASHENPCTGKRHDPGCSNCCDCTDCDCCCGDGCCCDCSCN